MAHRPTNRARNSWAVSLLEVQPTDRVLEVGFGPGLAVAELAARATRGHVYGVDHSEAMLRRASRYNDAAIRGGHVELVRASVDRLPSFDEAFDAILVANSVGFWTEPTERLRDLRGVLRPGGRVALVSQPRCPGATRETTARAAHELHLLLVQAGFTPVRAETLELDPPVACVLATSPVR